MTSNFVFQGRTCQRQTSSRGQEGKGIHLRPLKGEGAVGKGVVGMEGARTRNLGRSINSWKARVSTQFTTNNDGLGRREGT